MISERSILKRFTDELIQKYGLTQEDKDMIVRLVNIAIDDRLYTDTKDYNHDLKHIERVLMYVKMIINKMDNPNINEEWLLLAALYHDVGKTHGASSKDHGIVGASYFKKMMQGKLDPKDINTVCLLIYQHADEADTISFDDSEYTIEEKNSIQLMSDILKDADALDRNRLNYPPPIGGCDPNKLRTKEAKEFLSITDELYEEYNKEIIKEVEEETGKSILDNYELLEEWISDFAEGKLEMIHASLNPGIAKLIPQQSTQKGSYVYAGKSPIDCFSMAVFRLSLLFPRTDGETVGITEIYPGSVDAALNSKYITFYKMPSEKFHQYTDPVTSAPKGEWVSEEEVEPVEMISFKASSLLKFLRSTGQFEVRQDYSEVRRLECILNGFRSYIWALKELRDNPDVLNQKFAMLKSIAEYYSNRSDIGEILEGVRSDVDSIIASEKEKAGGEVDYDDEEHYLQPILDRFYTKLYKKDEQGRSVFDTSYVDSLGKKKEETPSDDDPKPHM